MTACARAVDLQVKPPKANSFTLSSDPLHDQKNLAIVDITLVSRALIDTGYSAEAIFILTDAFIRNVDECKDAEEAKAIARACAIHCTEPELRSCNKSARAPG